VLKKVRDVAMPLLSVIRVTPGQTEASAVNETHHSRSTKRREKNEDNEQDRRIER
jgi:hypothetical protein